MTTSKVLTYQFIVNQELSGDQAWKKEEMLKILLNEMTEDERGEVA